MDTGIDYRQFFQMPKVSRITSRTSSITNAFANSIIPSVAPTSEEMREALEILGMGTHVECAYCGDGSSEWDHLRPLVVNKRPTGYISEIHNMVPACGKCNQSKGNANWRMWMFGPARLSPATRKIPDIAARAERLEAYDAWKEPTKLDFEEFLQPDLWAAHWAN